MSRNREVSREDIGTSLLNMKEAFEKAASAADRARGAFEQLIETLRKDFDCDDLDEAVEMLEKLEDDASALKQDIEKQVNKLEKDYQWEK